MGCAASHPMPGAPLTCSSSDETDVIVKRSPYGLKPVAANEDDCRRDDDAVGEQGIEVDLRDGRPSSCRSTTFLGKIANCQHAAANSPERRPYVVSVDGVNSAHLPAQTSSHGQRSLWNNDASADSRDAAQHPSHAFSNRQWLVLPEQQYEQAMNHSHPPLPPFLGSTYWMQASPLPRLSEEYQDNSNRRAMSDAGVHMSFKSLITPSPIHESPAQFEQVSPDDLLKQYEVGLAQRRERLILRLNSSDDRDEADAAHTCSSRDGGEALRPSLVSPQHDLNRTLDTEDEEQEDANVMNAYSPAKDITTKPSNDTSAELLDYSSFLEESYSQDQRDKAYAVEKGTPLTPEHTPRRLFEEVDTTAEETTFEIDEIEQQRVLFETPERITRFVDDQGVFPRFPSVAKSSPSTLTFTTLGGTCRERHVSTLPSDEPIRLKVTDCSSHQRLHTNHTNLSQNSNNSPGDFCSFDPYFSTGKYKVTLRNGKPWGNGIHLKMSQQFMTLADSMGNVAAVVKSRYTHIPSVVLYSPRPRFAGQSPSTHGVSRDKKIVDLSSDNGSLVDHLPLYPWALISKSGRTMEDECCCYFIDEESASSASSSARSARVRKESAGLFSSAAAFRGKHGFDRGLHTHTLVSRVDGSDDVPCCVSVRDSNDCDVVDVTIAPGIDPVLMVCYLAAHMKMDIEPLLAGGL